MALTLIEHIVGLFHWVVPRCCFVSIGHSDVAWLSISSGSWSTLERSWQKESMMANNAFERSVSHCGPRLARHGGPRAAAQLGR